MSYQELPTDDQVNFADDLWGVDEFLAGVEVKHDAFREWIDAMNGPLPVAKVELTPHLVCDSRRPAPKNIPSEWSI